MHFFTKIQTCEKWKDVQRTLNYAKSVDSVEAPLASTSISAGRSIDNKKAKTVRNATVEPGPSVKEETTPKGMEELSISI
jgi:hypothetical protein